MRDKSRTEINEDEIRHLVETFYARVRADEIIGPFFNAKIPENHWPQHLLHIQDFWSSIFLRTGRFSGNPLAKHIRLSGLTPEHFARWLSLFQDTAQSVLEPAAADQFITMANRIGTSLQMGIAVHQEKAGHAEKPFAQFSLRGPLA